MVCTEKLRSRRSSINRCRSAVIVSLLVREGVDDDESPIVPTNRAIHKTAKPPRPPRSGLVQLLDFRLCGYPRHLIDRPTTLGFERLKLIHHLRLCLDRQTKRFDRVVVG